MPRSAMINKGNARSQCWVCHACHSSMQALIRSYSATPESKKLLDDMRTSNKQKWYALARQCRIRASVDEIGVFDIHSRKKAVLEACQPMAQAFGVRASSEVLWFDTRPLHCSSGVCRRHCWCHATENNKRRKPSGIVTLVMQTLSGVVLV